MNKKQHVSNKYKDIDPQETSEWLESIEDALENHGYERTDTF